jgi:hypothetical protein
MGEKGPGLPFAQSALRGKAERAASPASFASSASSAPPAPEPGGRNPAPANGTPRRAPEPGPGPARPADPAGPGHDRAAGQATEPGGPEPGSRADPLDGLVVVRPEPGAGQVAPRPGSQVEPAARPAAPRPGSEVTPSWAEVISTTLRLRRERRAALPQGRSRPARRTVGVLAVLVIVFAAGALTAVLVRHSGSGSAAGGQAASGNAATPGLAQVEAAAATRKSAAAWIAAQVSHSAVVSCDPAMCAALQAKGFPAGALMTLGPSASDPLGSAVIVSTEAVRSEFGSRLTSIYAPAEIASFGSGSARVDVRVYAAGGAAAYLAALRADELARQSAGRQLLRNSRVSASSAAKQQLAAGQVDSRLLSIIATLSGQGPVRIVAFSDSGPGASPGMPLRTAELASPPRARRGYLTSVLALLRAQQPPYLASSMTLARLAGGQQILRIEFAAPSPLGLLNN